MAYLGNFDQTTRHGVLLQEMLQVNEDADDRLRRYREMLIQMRTGDGSQLSHYDDSVKFFGWGGYSPVQGTPTDAQRTLARDHFSEVDSAFSKTSGNGQVSDVRAARDQLFAKHRG